MTHVRKLLVFAGFTYRFPLVGPGSSAGLGVLVTKSGSAQCFYISQKLTLTDLLVRSAMAILHDHGRPLFVVLLSVRTVVSHAVCCESAGDAIACADSAAGGTHHESR